LDVIDECPSSCLVVGIQHCIIHLEQTHLLCGRDMSGILDGICDAAYQVSNTDVRRHRVLQYIDRDSEGPTDPLNRRMTECQIRRIR